MESPSIDVSMSRDPRAELAFATRQLGDTLWFRPEWDAVYKTYGLRTHRLVAYRGERVVGLLSLVEMRSLLFGSHLVSLPWFDTAGVVADDAAVRDALVTGAVALAGRLGLRRVELRQEAAIEGWQVERDDKLTLRLALEPDPERLWKRFDPKVRNQVRKGEKSQLTYATGGIELIDPFYDVYSANMRDLGSPPHSREFFETVVTSFQSAATVHVVRNGAVVVGAGLTLANGSRLEIPWASSLQRHNRLCVNHFMYWNILKQACLDGYAWFSFGRSTRDSGQHHFKRQWGAQELSLFWYSLDRNGLCQTDMRAPQEGFGLAIRAWRKLPLFVVRSIGPRIICKVP